MLQVRAVTGKFAESSGSPLTWRQDMDLSGLNIMTLGIYYEALQRHTTPRGFQVDRHWRWPCEAADCRGPTQVDWGRLVGAGAGENSGGPPERAGQRAAQGHADSRPPGCARHASQQCKRPFPYQLCVRQVTQSEGATLSRTWLLIWRCRKACCTALAGAYQGFKSGFVLYGTEGTLQLDLDSQKLTLGLKSDGESACC